MAVLGGMRLNNKTGLALVLIYGVAASVGFFDLPSVNPTLKLSSLLFLSLFSTFYGTGYFRMKRLSDIDKLVSGLLSVVLVKVIFLYLTGRGLDSFPLDILLLVVLATRHPLPNAIAYTFVAAILNTARSYGAGEVLSLHDTLYRLTGLFSTVIITGVLLQNERKARVAAEARWERVESLAANIGGKEEKRDASSPAITKEEKDRLVIDSAVELNSYLARTLETISAITNSYSCCLFIPDGEIFRLSSFTSRSRRLVDAVPREKGKNLVNWVEEYNRPLCMDNVRDYLSLGYYSGDEGIRHFLAVPVTADKDEFKGVLSIDRKDPVFTKEDERLLTMAASSIAVFLESSGIISRMRIEAREFSAFYQFTKMLSTTLKLQEILETSINFSKEIVDYDIAAIALKDDAGGLKFVVAKGERSAPLLNGEIVRGKEFFQWVMEKGNPIQYYGSRMEKNIMQKLPQPFEKMGSFICIPLKLSDQAMGIFITARSMDLQYSAYEARLFEVLSANLSVAISNATIYKKMEELATRDGMTGLHNFRFFHERLSHEIERGARYNQPLSLILFDIDFFKKVNDTYGHPAGDKVLKGVAAILAASVREIDLAARYGGEEFVLLLINTDAKGAQVIAERVRASIERHIFDIGDGKTLRITSSMGISSVPSDAADQRLLISRADSALYLAKKDGRNRVYTYNEVGPRIEANEKTAAG